METMSAPDQTRIVDALREVWSELDALADLVELSIELCAISKSSQCIVPREVKNLSFGTSSIRNVFDDRYPATRIHGLPRNQHRPPVS